MPRAGVGPGGRRPGRGRRGRAAGHRPGRDRWRPAGAEDRTIRSTRRVDSTSGPRSEAPGSRNRGPTGGVAGVRLGTPGSESRRGIRSRIVRPLPRSAKCSAASSSVEPQRRAPARPSPRDRARRRPGRPPGSHRRPPCPRTRRSGSRCSEPLTILLDLLDGSEPRRDGLRRRVPVAGASRAEASAS